MSNNKLNVFQKMNKVYSELNGIPKGKFVPTNKGGAGYWVVEHDDVTKLLQPLVTKHGLVCIPDITKTEITMREFTDSYQNKKVQYRVDLDIEVRIQNIDDKSDFIISRASAYAFDNGDKATGKAYSMAVKYAYLKAFMLESHDREEDRTNPVTSSPAASNAPAQKKSPSYTKTELDGVIEQALKLKVITERPPTEEQIETLRGYFNLMTPNEVACIKAKYLGKFAVDLLIKKYKK